MSLLQIGSTGPAVSRLSRQLASAGFAPDAGESDVFDVAIQRSVLLFQSQHIGPDGLPLDMDGKVGPLTEFALGTAHVWQGEPAILTLPPPVCDAMPADASRPGWNALQVALGEMQIGAGEIGGRNAGPYCRKYHAITGSGEGAPWCAPFIAFCLARGNTAECRFDGLADARDAYRKIRKAGWTYQPTAEKPPAPGDLIFWWRNATRPGDGHIGIVSGYAHGIVHTIEGNRTSRVEAFHYRLGCVSSVLGFARVQP